MKKTLIFFCILAMGACKEDKKVNEVVHENEPPNIVVIFTDELQFEDIGYFGGNIPTPRIDELIRSGMLFNNAYTPEPMCTPSRYALLTGRYAGKCKAPEFIMNNPVTEPYSIALNTYLDSSAVTLPRLLSVKGYTTGMSGKWHLGGEKLNEISFTGTRGLEDPKMDSLLGLHQQLVIDKVKHEGGFDYAKSVIYGNYDMFPVPALHYHNFPWVTHGAVQFLEDQAGTENPFFLYITPTALHGPHHAAGLMRDYAYTPEGKVPGLDKFMPNIDSISRAIDTLSASKKHRFSGMAFLDHQVGLILDKIKALGMEKNTIVVFLPDHNTEPAKATAYEKGVKIPIVVRWPERVKSGTIANATIQTVDLFPTLLSTAGVDQPLNHEVDGLNILPIFDDPNEELRAEIFSEAGFTRALRHGRYKYIALRYSTPLIDSMKNGLLDHAPNYLNMKNQGQSIIAAHFYPHYFDADQLYDLSTDPYEQNNLAYDPAYQQILQDMQARLQNYLNRFDHPFDLADTSFLRTEQFFKLTAKSREQKPEDVPWYKRDWEKIIWPPAPTNVK